MGRHLRRQKERLQSRIRGYVDQPGRKVPGSMNPHKGSFASKRKSR